MSEPRPDLPSEDGHGSLLTLALLSLIVGLGAGLVGAAFRLALEQGDRMRNALIVWAHGRHFAPGRSNPIIVEFGLAGFGDLETRQ
jgi:hypothetical protein